jgi:hypothetical protein
MILLTAATLALASAPQRLPAPVALPAVETSAATAQVIGCHPQPGKVAACASPYGVVRPDPARRAKPAAETRQTMQFCHPDPSKNRAAPARRPPRHDAGAHSRPLWARPQAASGPRARITAPRPGTNRQRQTRVSGPGHKAEAPPDTAPLAPSFVPSGRNAGGIVVEIDG